MYQLNNKPREFSKASSLLQNYDFVDRITQNSKYLKNEFQDFGVRLAHKLQDPKHKALYIKLAKELPRGILEQALTFTLDYPTRDNNKGRLYMWKLNEICAKKGIKMPGGFKKKQSKTKKKLQQFDLFSRS
jgi:hypothetical protein